MDSQDTRDWQNIYDANSDSSSSGNSMGSEKSLSNSNSNMSTTSTTDSSRSAKSSNGSEMLDSGSVESAADGPAVSNSRELEGDFTTGSLLMSPPGEEDPAKMTLHCTGCKSSSPAVANCFSCPSLLCANCVVAHQLMVAFEGHNVTNLGQAADNKENNGAVGNNTANVEAIKKIAKDGRKKLNELQKTVKSVDYSSSRYVWLVQGFHSLN